MNKSWLILSVACVAAPAFADGDKDVKISGSVDGYYQWNLNNTPGDLSLRPFDGKVKQITLNTARFKAVKAAKGKQFGFTASLVLGKTPDAGNELEPGGRDRYRIFEEAFLTFNAGKGTLDLGKFNCLMGYEANDVTQNAHYSKSFNTSIGEPNYHAGLRYNTTLGDMPAQFYAVTGWSEVEDSNKHLGLGVRVDKKLNEQLNVSANYYNGHEGRLTPTKNNSNSTGGIGFAIPGERDVHAFNLNGTYAANATTKLGFDMNYGNAYHVDAVPNMKWSGLAGYISYVADKKTTVSLRSEVFRDIDGGFTGTDQDLASTTLSLGYQLSNDQKLMVEWRGDRSNKSIFAAKSGGTKSYRDSLLVGFQVKF